MNWSTISDREIVKIMTAIKEGRINPETKTYIFKLSDDRNLGVDSTTEAGARDYCDFKNYKIKELVDINPMTFNGMTILEIQIEAKKRGLEGEIING